MKILVFLGAVTHRAVTITSKLEATEEWTFKVRFRLYEFLDESDCFEENNLQQINLFYNLFVTCFTNCQSTIYFCDFCFVKVGTLETLLSVLFY